MQCRKVKIKSGYVWECVEDGPRNHATGKRRQIRRRGRTKRESQNKVEDVINKLEKDGIDESVANKITFSEIALKWLDVYTSTGV